MRDDAWAHGQYIPAKICSAKTFTILNALSQIDPIVINYTMRRCVKYDSMHFGQLWQWEPCSQVSARIPWRNLGSEPTAHRLGHKSTFCSGSPEMDAPFMSIPVFIVSVIQSAFANTCRCNNCCSTIDFLSSVVGYSAPDGIAHKTNQIHFKSEHPAFVVL